jgi:hypothetical protein
MQNPDISSDPDVARVFANYPDHVRPKLLALRDLIIEAAGELEDVATLEETLKWGEPSYITKHGSTLRMDWKPKSPNQYALYFKCTSRLVETFRAVFKDTFTFEGNRAIVFQLEQSVPVRELKLCIQAALTYHKVKVLPTLGIDIQKSTANPLKENTAS